MAMALYTYLVEPGLYPLGPLLVEMQVRDDVVLKIGAATAERVHSERAGGGGKPSAAPVLQVHHARIGGK